MEDALQDAQEAEHPSILLVEDEDDVRAALRDVLTYLGCRVIEARSGMEALNLAERHGGQIRAALVDARLPGLSGSEVCLRLSVRHPDVPLVLITGYLSGAELAGTGARYLLKKPFGIKTLAQVLLRLGLPIEGLLAAAA